MTRLAIVFLFVWSLSEVSYTAKFYLYNTQFSGNYQSHLPKYNDPVLRDFRVRIVADNLFEASADKITAYLDAYQFSVEKANVPHLLTESNPATIHNLKQPTKKITVLVTADGYKDGVFTQKFLLYSENLELSTALSQDSTLKIDVRSFFQKDGNIQMEFSSFLEKNKGLGFMPIETKRVGYLVMY